MGRIMVWAGSEKHMGGIPRNITFLAVGAFAKAVANLLNTTSVHNADTLLRLVRSRPPGLPLITVSNHMSTLDDPVLWGFKGFPATDAKLARWVLSAEDICFKNSVFSYFFRLGKCIPITRGAGIYQEHMNEALECLNNGAWLHTFPEGKVYQEDAPIRRLKWGTASLIVRAHVTPIVLPIVHSGFQEKFKKKIWLIGRSVLVGALQQVMPEKYFLDRRPLVPLCNKKIKIMIGEPLEFDIPKLSQSAISNSRGNIISSSTATTGTSKGWPVISSNGTDLDEAAQKCLYSTISEKIQTAMEELRRLGKSLLK